MARNSVCAVLIFLLAGVVHAGDLNEILAKVKAASGGAAWDAIRTARSKMTISVGGLTGTGEALDDVTLGRYVDHFKLGPMSGAEGYDGTVAWSQDASGQSRAEEGGDGRLGAVNESYRRAYGFWYPERWPAQIEDAGTQEENGRQFFVVRITPKGGRPFDLWIDAATMLVDMVAVVAPPLMLMLAPVAAWVAIRAEVAWAPFWSSQKSGARSCSSRAAMRVVS